jgi:hypothetical protein
VHLCRMHHVGVLSMRQTLLGYSLAPPAIGQLYVCKGTCKFESANQSGCHTRTEINHMHCMAACLIHIYHCSWLIFCGSYSCCLLLHFMRQLVLAVLAQHSQCCRAARAQPLQLFPDWEVRLRNRSANACM